MTPTIETPAQRPTGGRLLRLTVLVALACASGLASAQSPSAADRIADLERKLEQSLRQLEVLGERMKQLEAAAPAAASRTAALPAAAARPAPSAPDVAAKVADLEQQVLAIQNKPPADDGVALHGFADVGGATGSAGRPRGGNIGLVDFYLTPKFTDRVRALMEIAMEVTPGGEIALDLERLQIGYTFSDALNVWFGRFHTPYGYWNTAFHHGAQIQTSILRPRFLDFEDKGGILPAHSVGVWANGGQRVGSGKLSYDLYFANAPRIGMGDPTLAGTGTLNPNLAAATGRAGTTGATVSYAFSGDLSGLSIGAHALNTKVGDDLAAGSNLTRIRMFGGFGVYTENDWEVLAEYYAFRNEDVSGGTGSRSSRAAYMQVGRTFGQWTPFARHEFTRLDQGDNYFAQQESGQSYRRNSIGLRYDINPKTALKFEATRTQLTDRAVDSYSELRTQLAVRF
jgi:hypothetical protein